MNSEPYFDTIEFLQNLERKTQTQEFNRNDYLTMDRLCKKIDVAKRLYKYYSADLTTKKSDEEVSLRLYCSGIVNLAT